jgi:hypothetical protein
MTKSNGGRRIVIGRTCPARRPWRSTVEVHKLLRIEEGEPYLPKQQGAWRRNQEEEKSRR